MRRWDRGTWLGDARMRSEERRAEASLSKALRQLDNACLYHLNTLTREQRRLHRDLGALKTGNLWRKNTPGLQPGPWNHDLNHLILPNKRTWLPIIAQSSRGAEQPCFQKPIMGAGGSSSSLQARIQEFMSSGDHQAEGLTATHTVCLPDLSIQTVDKSSTIGQEMQKEQCEKRTDEDTGTQMGGEVNRLSTSLPNHALAPDGRLRTVYTLPSFAQALSAARKARYLRHRGQPLSEKELSISEIFSRTPSDI